jgi:hypothetical protein
MRIAVALFMLGGAAVAHAQGPTVVKRLEGYACARLNATEAQMLDPHGTGIFIRMQPSPTAPVGTAAPSVVFVRRPAHIVNGYAEVVQITGQPGWIEASKIKPFDGLTRCVPSLMSNGRIGAG